MITKNGQRSIFLVDAIGAAISIILLAVVLPIFQDLIGMPLPALYFLAIIAVCCGAYSLSCFLRQGALKIRGLTSVIIANLLYCVATAALVLYYFTSLTIWGLAYFLADLAVILGLVIYEKRLLEAWKNA